MAITIQIFGTKKSPATRAALRFFAERRLKVHFVDLNERAASVGELRRFAQKFGVGKAGASRNWASGPPATVRTPGSLDWRTSRCCSRPRWCGTRIN